MSTSNKTGWLDLIWSAESQSKFYEEYKKALEAAVSLGLNEDVLKSLADGSEKSAQTLMDIVSGGETVVSQINALYDESKKGKESLSAVIAGIFGTDEDENTALADINSQIEVLEAYDERLNALRERGLPDSVMAEILSMGVEDAIKYSDTLLSQSDESWDAYMQALQKKQELASDIADKWYQDEFTNVANEYMSTLETGLANLQSYTFDFGKSAVDGIIQGMKAQEGALAKEAANLANIVKSATTSGQLSFVGSYATGLKYVPYDDFPALLHKGERVLTKEEAEAYLHTPYLADMPTASKGNQEAAIVNALNTVAASIPSQGSGDMQITFVINGERFARATLQDFRNASKQNPQIEGMVQ